MTPDEQRIAIAKACGYRIVEGFHAFPSLEMVKRRLPPEIFEQIGAVDHETIPDYPADLNAMHAAVASQDNEFQHEFEVMMNHHSSVTGKLFCRMDAADWADIFLQVKRKNEHPRTHSTVGIHLM